MGLSFTKREIRLQSGILHYKMGFLGYKRDSHVAIHPLLSFDKYIICEMHENINTMHENIQF